MDYYSFTDPGGMDGRVSLLSGPIADSLPIWWSSVNHRSGAGQGKSDGPKTGVLTTEPRHQVVNA